MLLERQGRLTEAARLASSRGQARDASALFERACEWRDAATEALKAGDAARALEMAAEGAETALAEEAAARLAGDPRLAGAVATRLAQRGLHRWAARILETSGEPIEAALAWERAGEVTKAAALFQREGDPGRAARVLEGALRRDPGAAGAAVALGELLAQAGKTDAAVRVLQSVPSGAPERRHALGPLVGALARLGLHHAALEAATELQALGGPCLAPAPEQGPRGTRLFGRFDVLREVSSSPRARVLECIDCMQGQRAALKLFTESAGGAGREAFERYRQEVRVLGALDHPNIVVPYDFFPHALAVAVPWLGGGTLTDALATGPLAPSRAAEIACALLSALGEAHAAGILHRDVKPTNVLFDAAGGPRLSDFGAAHLADVSATVTAETLGALGYASPEQRQGRGATIRSDLFAVGVVFREMLTGKPPSAQLPGGPSPSEAHGELDHRHDELVAQLTSPRAEERPASAFEARALCLSLPWSGAADPRTDRTVFHRTGGTRLQEARLEPDVGGNLIDTWTGRAVERVPLSDAVLGRARAFAAADHPGLQTVLRVDVDTNTLWLAAINEPTPRPLEPTDRARLAEALAALHAADVPYGKVTTASFGTGEDGRIVLRFDGGPTSGT